MTIRQAVNIQILGAALLHHQRLTTVISTSTPMSPLVFIVRDELAIILRSETCDALPSVVTPKDLFTREDPIQITGVASFLSTFQTVCRKARIGLRTHHSLSTITTPTISPLRSSHSFGSGSHPFTTQGARRSLEVPVSCLTKEHMANIKHRW